MKDYKFAIIGGAGFLGSRLKERFDKEGQEYLIYDINTSAHKDKTVYLDVEAKDSLDQLTLGASRYYKFSRRAPR